MIDYNEIIKENSILESKRLILRPFSIEDVDDVFLYTSDDSVTKYLTWPSYKDISETEEVVKKIYIGRIGVFAIELKSQHKCIGCIDLRVCIEHNKANFGYVLNRKYWNNNYMSEALSLILDLSFSKLELNRIEATHYVGNEGSGRVMQKCGMKYEGTGLQEVKVKGTFYDVVHYAILSEHWINLTQVQNL
ncbi:GNAT family N-acetyltransferase [Clostridium tagluense]|uniref:N-acetyltransferase n=1 Tax=Clostridium tagluense TaxID=360422 RepID=A0A401UNE5_9CLOT|nr:GNAT family protein [Clostridium tagluense]GCD11050.1 N-acetyltransferase [Clostridium tagluense]